MLHFTRWKILLILGVTLLGVLFFLPNVLPQNFLERAPGWFPKGQVNLGLDLRGGSYLLLELDGEAVLTERLNNLLEETRLALRRERIGYTNISATSTGIHVRLRKDEDVPTALKLLKNLEAAGGRLFASMSGASLLVKVQSDRTLVLEFTKKALRENVNNALVQTLEVVRRRIDELGTTDPTIQRQGNDRILVEVPGFDDPQHLKAVLGRTAKLQIRMVDPSQVSQRAPPGSEILLYKPDMAAQATPMAVRRRVIVGGEHLVDAQPGYDEYGRPQVTFRLNTAGGRRFYQMTRSNIGARFAIILDNEIISAPVIEAAIASSGRITNIGTLQDAQDLALLMRAGALPAPLTVLEERSVGPSLGADSIEAGKRSCVLGLLAILLFMALVYRRFGVFADIALLVNLVLILGVLSLLQATLTLPGIAGIVLTIGMAVDANVLIFERMREERQEGKTLINALDSGYRRALGTIMDANLTTLIAAVVLFFVGSGPVRGVAVTLGIGIVTSVFTAVYLTRLMIATWLWRAAR